MRLKIRSLRRSCLQRCTSIDACIVIQQHAGREQDGCRDRKLFSQSDNPCADLHHAVRINGHAAEVTMFSVRMKPLEAFEQSPHVLNRFLFAPDKPAMVEGRDGTNPFGLSTSLVVMEFASQKFEIKNTVVLRKFVRSSSLSE